MPKLCEEEVVLVKTPNPITSRFLLHNTFVCALYFDYLKYFCTDYSHWTEGLSNSIFSSTSLIIILFCCTLDLYLHRHGGRVVATLVFMYEIGIALLH